MSTVIEVKQLSKQFKARAQQGMIQGLLRPKFQIKDAVKGISFAVEKGEAVAFLGPNGAGKTTTTKMMTGLIYPSSGSVRVLGYEPFRRRPEFLRRIGLVMGNKAGLNWDLTPTQSFWLFKNIYGMSDKAFEERVEHLTTMLDVAQYMDTPVRRLSLGERMKLELIGAILHNPEVLFLDEPTIGLDIIAKKNIRRFLKKIQTEYKITLILTSHDMDDIEQVCERVIVINHGTKVFDGSLQALTDRHKAERYVRLVLEKIPEQWTGHGEVIERTDESILIRIPADKLSELIAQVSDKHQLLDMQVESVPLEEVMEEVFTTSAN